MAFDRKVLAAVVLASAASSAYGQINWDLTGATPGSFFYDGGYLFPGLSSVVSGSGTFNSIVRLQTSPTEQGYNVAATANRMTDVKAGVSLQPNALTRPAAGSPIGTNWFTFALDLNETASVGARYISLDQLTLFGSSVDLETLSFPSGGTDAQKLAFLRTNAVPIWSMDSLGSDNAPDGVVSQNLLLDYNTVSGGSGKADVLFVLEEDKVPTQINGVSNYFIYLYFQMGNVGVFGGRDFSSDAGFEEWNTASGLIIDFPPVIPEASTWFAGVSLTALVGGMWYRRRKTA